MSFLGRLFGSDAPPNELVKEYRDTATRDRYRFKFVERNGHYDIYCIDRPRDPHHADSAVTHLFAGGKICVASSVKVSTLSMAKAIATHWMMAYSQFVRSADGTWPRNGRVRVNVPD